MSKLIALALASIMACASSSVFASQVGKNQNPLMPKAAKPLSRTQAAKIVGHGEMFPILYVLPINLSGKPIGAATFPVPVTTYGNNVPPPPPAAALDASYGLVNLRSQTLQ